MLPFVLLILWIGSASGACCPDRFVSFGDACYLFDRDAVDFTEAEHFCSQHNAHLVKVDTPEENGFLKDFMSDYHSIYWLGLSDKTVEGFWRWSSDDTRVEFTDWGAHEPNDGGSGEDCAIFDTHHHMQWSDVQCSRSFRPLCKLRTSGEVFG